MIAVRKVCSAFFPQSQQPASGCRQKVYAEHLLIEIDLVGSCPRHGRIGTIAQRSDPGLHFKIVKQTGSIPHHQPVALIGISQQPPRVDNLTCVNQRHVWIEDLQCNSQLQILIEIAVDNRSQLRQGPAVEPRLSSPGCQFAAEQMGPGVFPVLQPRRLQGVLCDMANRPVTQLNRHSCRELFMGLGHRGRNVLPVQPRLNLCVAEAVLAISDQQPCQQRPEPRGHLWRDANSGCQCLNQKRLLIDSLEGTRREFPQQNHAQ